jgi:hypothetical protein
MIAAVFALIADRDKTGAGILAMAAAVSFGLLLNALPGS